MISEKKRKAIVEALLEVGKPATRSDLKGFATKDSTLSREKRSKEGNWRGSLGRYVESHGAEINAAFDSHQLRNYVETTMKSALEPEAQAYLDELLASCQSERRLLQALYNVALKGTGMGLHENKNNMKKFDYRKYLKEGYLFQEAGNVGYQRLIPQISNLVSKLKDEEGLVDLRPAGMDLDWGEGGAYLLSQGEDGQVYVSTGPEDAPMMEDDVTLEELADLLQENGATGHEVDVFFDTILEALKVVAEM